jgi:hypothetical protein
LLWSAVLVAACGAVESPTPEDNPVPVETPPSPDPQDDAVLRSKLARNNAPNVPQADMTALVEGQNAFAFALYEQPKLKSTPRDNFFYSPLSISQALAGTSCGSEMKSTVQLVLTPDPAVSSVDALLKQMDRIDVVVDAADGLHGVTTAGSLPGGGTAVDWDGDGVLEARFEGPPLGRDALPVLELGVNENVDCPLTFRVFGLPPGDSELDHAAGEGGASASVSSGEIRRVGAPFNLTPRARPPRVLLVIPPEGAEVRANLLSIAAVLSVSTARSRRVKQWRMRGLLPSSVPNR